MKLVILYGIAAVMLGVSTTRVEACYCSVPRMDKALARARAVFIGEVIEIVDPLTLDDKAPPPGHFYTIRFKVEKSWKGFPSKEASVLSAQGKYGCLGYPPVRKGEKYLVFADPLYFGGRFHQDWLIITICNRTKLLENASEDLKKLRVITNSPSSPHHPRRLRN